MKKRKLLYILTTMACGFTCIFAFTNTKKRIATTYAENETTGINRQFNTTATLAIYEELQNLIYNNKTETNTIPALGATSYFYTLTINNEKLYSNGAYFDQIIATAQLFGTTDNYAQQIPALINIGLNNTQTTLGTGTIFTLNNKTTYIEITKNANFNTLNFCATNITKTITYNLLKNITTVSGTNNYLSPYETENQTQQTINQLQTNINTLSSENANLQATINTIQSEQQTLQVERDYYYNLITTKEATITDLTNEITSLNSQITSLNNQITTLQNQINTKDTTISNLTNQITSLNNQITSLNNQIKEITEDIENAGEIIISLNNQIAEKTTTIANLTNQNTELTTNLNTKTQQYNNLLAEYNNIIETDYYIENEQLRNNNTTLQNALDHADSSNFDIIGTMFQVLTMPFTFISQAFNLTLFPNTPYQINFANLFKGLIAIATLLFIVRLLTNGLNTIGNVQKEKSQTELNRSQTQLNKAKTEKIKNTNNKND